MSKIQTEVPVVIPMRVSVMMTWGLMKSGSKLSSKMMVMEKVMTEPRPAIDTTGMRLLKSSYLSSKSKAIF